MFAAGIVLSVYGVPAPALTATYACHEEVRWLGEDQGTLLAGTGGGLLEQSKGEWFEVEPRLPCSVIHYGEGAVTTPSGNVMRVQGSKWVEVGPSTLGAKGDTVACDTPRGRVESLLASRFLTCASGNRPAPPAEKVYALLWYQDRLWAGTSAGLWSEEPSGWIREKLPSTLPSQRLHGLAILGRKWLIGGPEGLWDGEPGNWRSLDQRPVRQVSQFAGAAWVLFGDGSVDKLDLSTGKRYDDVLLGAVKRPWSSVLSVGANLLFGGIGGWVEKSSKTTTETRPEALRGEVVTAMLANERGQYVGTQSSGVFRTSKTGTENIGLLQGLEDTWVTSLATLAGTVYVGTSNGGLSRLDGDRAKAVPVPTRSINHLAVWHGTLVIGGNDGAWTNRLGEWERIGPDDTETTGLALADGGLFVLTPYGAYRYD